MNKKREKTVAELISSVCEKYDADVFTYSGEITDEGYGKLIEVVLSSKTRKNVVLILVTTGGSGNVAYSIARFLHKIYEKFYLYVPSFCKSAGTLIALGAHELIMDTFSELGPLDVQLLKQNELGVRKSGLLSRSALEGLSESSFELFEDLMLRILRKSGGLISFRLASQLSSDMTSSQMSGIFAKVDPDIVGSDRRDLDVATEYGMRLVSVSENASFSTVRHLVHQYPSHDFIIDDEEARHLFENVTYPIPELMMLSGLLGKMAYNEEILVMSVNDLDEDVEEEVDDRSGDNEAVKSSSSGNDKDRFDPVGAGSHDRAGDSEEEGFEDRSQDRSADKTSGSDIDQSSIGSAV